MVANSFKVEQHPNTSSAVDADNIEELPDLEKSNIASSGKFQKV